MRTNALPHYDMSVNTTGCCHKFNPDGWDDVELHFEGKPFVRATTRSAMHIPINMGSVFNRVHGHIEDAGGWDADNTIVLSRDLSAWEAEHLFATDLDVEGEERVTLSGDFVTKVFEGPYSEAKNGEAVMRQTVEAHGGTPSDIWFYYTTCPKCAKAYGQNYIVGVAKMEPAQ